MGSQRILHNWVTDTFTGWKNFDMIEKACTEDLINENKYIKGCFGEGSEGNKKYSRESVFYLKGYYIFISRMVIEMWMLKLFL